KGEHDTLARRGAPDLLRVSESDVRCTVKTQGRSKDSARDSNVPNSKRRLTESELEKRRKAALHFRQQGAELVANLIEAGDVAAAARALDEFLGSRLAEPVKLEESGLTLSDIRIKDDEPERAERASAAPASLLLHLAQRLSSAHAVDNAMRANGHRSQ